MSYNLSISGHHSDPDAAEAIDDLVKAKGQELIDGLRALGHEPANATFAGPSGSVNYLAIVEEPAEGEPDPDSAEAAPDPE